MAASTAAAEPQLTIRLTPYLAEGMLRPMGQLSLFGITARHWTVSEINRHVRQVLEMDIELRDVWVEGELSNLSRPSSGHIYFTLKDSQASLRCIMWRSEAAQLERMPRAGEAVEVHGHVGVYEAGGQYQLYADSLRPAGEGRLYQAFLMLKDRLEKEGLFDPERKRPLPEFPKRIGVVTSPTGAALRDVVHVLRRRFPLVEVVLASTPVQGDEAPAGIVSAIEAVNRYARPDVILVVRGGGSIEDLWAFNDEEVARAIADSAAPVVSGIGHETDFVIADFVADRRAPTPSAAAEIATPDQRDLSLDVKNSRNALTGAFRELLGEELWALEQQRASLQRFSPHAQVVNARQKVDDLLRRSLGAVRHNLALRRAGLGGLTQTLAAVGPPAVLARGYAVVTLATDGTVVRRVDQVSPGDLIDARVSDGSFTAEVGSGENTAVSTRED
ncbi:MAG TPA: exodeoxyribonuclease VII large subunit [Anaerolineales bacterium]|nr:exodeoxyribonuclease VII large subunit [Anaerolineales bacterium]